MKAHLTNAIGLSLLLLACDHAGVGRSAADEDAKRTPAAKAVSRASAQPKNRPKSLVIGTFEKQRMFADMPVQGTVVGGLKWQDKLGENLIFFSQRESAIEPNEALDIPDLPARNRALFAAHYLKPGDGSATVLKRLVRDAVGPCQFDLTARYLEDSFGVTDLDKNGVGEATFAYELACTSDVSPKTLKLLMLEGGEKYILRGTRVTSIGRGKTNGGDFTPGSAMTKEKPLFLGYASQLWKRLARVQTSTP